MVRKKKLLFDVLTLMKIDQRNIYGSATYGSLSGCAWLILIGVIASHHIWKLVDVQYFEEKVFISIATLYWDCSFILSCEVVKKNYSLQLRSCFNLDKMLKMIHNLGILLWYCRACLFINEKEFILKSLCLTDDSSKFTKNEHIVLHFTSLSFCFSFKRNTT